MRFLFRHMVEMILSNLFLLFFFFLKISCDAQIICPQFTPVWPWDPDLSDLSTSVPTTEECGRFNTTYGWSSAYDIHGKWKKHHHFLRTKHLLELFVPCTHRDSRVSLCRELHSAIEISVQLFADAFLGISLRHTSGWVFLGNKWA